MVQFTKPSSALGAITDGMHLLLENSSRATNCQELIYYPIPCLTLITLEKITMLALNHC